MKGIVFLDRDGIINQEIGDYVYREQDFVINNGVPEALKNLKSAGYKLVIITNQGGIGKGIYSADEVWNLYDIIQNACEGIIDDMYFSPWAPIVSKSLSAKPGTMMFERAMHKYGALPSDCWMIGDAERDMQPAAQLGIPCIFVPTLKEQSSVYTPMIAQTLLEAVNLYILRG